MPIISKDQINHARGEFRREFGGEATPQTGRLIRELLNTILNEPDPRWDLSPEMREQLAYQILKELPMIFRDIAREERTGRTVSAPDVLHWLRIKVPERIRAMGFVFDKE